MISPTPVKNYYHSGDIAAHASTITVLINHPIVLKGIQCGKTQDNADGSTYTEFSFSFRLFDGDSEIIRIYESPDGAESGGCLSYWSFSFPLNGIRINDSLGIRISAVAGPDAIPAGFAASGISVVYQ